MRSAQSMPRAQTSTDAAARVGERLLRKEQCNVMTRNATPSLLTLHEGQLALQFPLVQGLAFQARWHCAILDAPVWCSASS